MPSYQELKSQADERWHELTNGDVPWIRVGTAMCGHAAGAFQVLDAIRAELAIQHGRRRFTRLRRKHGLPMSPHLLL